MRLTVCYRRVAVRATIAAALPVVVVRCAAVLKPSVTVSPCTTDATFDIHGFAAYG